MGDTIVVWATLNSAVKGPSRSPNGGETGVLDAVHSQASSALGEFYRRRQVKPKVRLWAESRDLMLQRHCTTEHRW